MTTNPMTTQVAHVVGNLLAAGGEVWLPGVGTLYTERIGARRLSKKTVAPPSRVVSFTSQQRGVSLVDEIARAAQCPPAEGQEIYDRWLSRVHQGEALTIGGVGVLNFKNFTLDAAFDRRLNPQGHAPVRIASKGGADWVLWLGVVAILGAVGLFGYQYVPDFLRQNPMETGAFIEPFVPETGESPLAPAAVDPLDTSATAALAESTTSSRAPQAEVQSGAAAQPGATTPAAVAPQTAAAPRSTEPGRMVAGRKYVVLGVFSTPENASRAVRDAAQKDATTQCGVYRFGEKYLVAAFDADNAEACTEFIRQKGSVFPGLWTYAAR